MAKTYQTPLYYDESRKTHAPILAGQYVDVGVVPVSGEAGNEIVVKEDGLYVSPHEFEDQTIVSKDDGNVVVKGTDGGALLTKTALEDLMGVYLLQNPIKQISDNDWNLLRLGSDAAAYLTADDVLSNGDVNLLTVDGTDHKVILLASTITENVDFVSLIDGNLLKRDADGKYYVTIDELFASDDPLLYVNECGEIATDLALQYDDQTGTFKLVNHSGAVISEVTVKPTLAVLKNVELDGTELVFTFALADGTERVLRISLQSFVDIYKAGDGLKLSDDGTFSVDLASTGHLYVNSNGRLAVDVGSMLSDGDGNALVVDSDGKLYVPEAEKYYAGTALSLSDTNHFHVKVSSQEGNKLSVVNDALYAEGITDIGDLISQDADNAIHLGSDEKLYSCLDYGTME